MLGKKNYLWTITSVSWHCPLFTGCIYTGEQTAPGSTKKQHRHGNHSMDTAYWFFTFLNLLTSMVPSPHPISSCQRCLQTVSPGGGQKVLLWPRCPCSWTGWQKRTRCSFWSGEQRGPNRADSFMKMSQTLLRYTQHLQLISQGTFLVVRWLRLHTPNARGGVGWWWGGWVQPLAREPDPICRNLKSCM